MAKRKRGGRRSKLDHFPWLAGIGLIGYFALEPTYGVGVVVLLGAVALLLWFLFLMPTKCDFEVQGRGCRRNVYGKVRGCHDHWRDKRDAMFAALRMRNPGMAFRVMWLSGSSGGRPLGGAGAADGAGASDPASSSGNRGQAMFNMVSLIVALVGSAAGVLALFLSK